MCPVTGTARLTLPMDHRAAAQARRFLRQAHCGTHHAGVLDSAQLLISELVSNAVRHGAPPITLEIDCDETRGMTARVGDGNPRSPVLARAGDDDESGRGVALVDLISDAWGVDPARHGKEVWFRLNACRE